MVLSLMVKLMVPPPDAETKIPLPVLEPESAVPDTPMELLITWPLSSVPALCLPRAMAEPLASRIVLPLTTNVIEPDDCRMMLLPPMMLLTLLFERLLFLNCTSMLEPACVATRSEERRV